MVTIFIVVVLIVIRCTVVLSTGSTECSAVPFTNVGVAITAGAEILFELPGIISIIRKKGND